MLAEDVTAAISAAVLRQLGAWTATPSHAADIAGAFRTGARDSAGDQRDRGRRHRRLPDGRPGTAIKIMTGARLPAGADAVVPVEWTDGGIDRVAIYQPGRAGQRGPVRGRRRRRGRDAADGRDADAADADRGGGVGGREAVTVRPRPRVVVLSTGQRADRAGHAAGARPDLGFQQLHARGGGPRGRRASPHRRSGRARRPGRRAARPRRAADPGRPADHHRRGQHGRRARRGQGGAAPSSAP